MRAFTKLDRKPVGDRSAVSQADIVIYLDNTLFGEGWEAELKEGGKVLVNTQETFDDPEWCPLTRMAFLRQFWVALFPTLCYDFVMLSSEVSKMKSDGVRARSSPQRIPVQ